MTKPGRMPAKRQITANTDIAAIENASVSREAAAAAVRGRPRNVTPNALTKQAAASAAESASSAPTAGTRTLSPHCESWGLTKMAWKVSHSDTKPFNGGRAEIATQPTRNRKLVHFIRWIS